MFPHKIFNWYQKRHHVGPEKTRTVFTMELVHQNIQTPGLRVSFSENIFSKMSVSNGHTHLCLTRVSRASVSFTKDHSGSHLQKPTGVELWSWFNWQGPRCIFQGTDLHSWAFVHGTRRLIAQQTAPKWTRPYRGLW